MEGTGLARWNGTQGLYKTLEQQDNRKTIGKGQNNKNRVKWKDIAKGNSD